MELDNISPVLHRVHSYRYKRDGHAPPRLSERKTQYSYRFMYVEEGSLDIELSDGVHSLRADSLVYLLPGDRYRLLPCGEDFSFVSLFFDLSPVTSPVGRRSCVFDADFEIGASSVRLQISDSPRLDCSCVLPSSGCRRIIDSLTSPSDSFYRFMAKGKLIELLHHLLASDESPCGAKCTADGVVAYIDANPTAALTSDALAEHFGYHKNYLNRLVKEHTGLTLSGCIRRSRISYAMAQMAETGAAPSELAAELGYYDYSHFYKAFVAECGCTPGEFCRSE